MKQFMFSLDIGIRQGALLELYVFTEFTELYQ